MNMYFHACEEPFTDFKFSHFKLQDTPMLDTERIVEDIYTNFPGQRPMIVDFMSDKTVSEDNKVPVYKINVTFTEMAFYVKNLNIL